MSVLQSQNWSPSYQGGSKPGVTPSGYNKSYSNWLNSNPKDYSYSLDENRNLVRHKIDRSDLSSSGARKEQIKFKSTNKGGSSRNTTSTSKYGGGGYMTKNAAAKRKREAFNNAVNRATGSGSSGSGGGGSSSGGGYSGGGSSSGGSSGSGKTAKAKKGLAVVKGSSTAGLAIGLNANKIVAIEAALDAYIKSVISAIGVGAKQKNVALAIKGAAAQVEVRKYIASMDKACEKLFRDLEKYKKILEQMKSNYASNDKFNNSASIVSGSSHPNIASVGFTLNK